MIKVKKDHARTHEEKRYIICLICQKKKNDCVQIPTHLKELIFKFFEYDDNDERLPKVLCRSCKTKIYKNNRSVFNSNSLKSPDYSNFSKIAQNTRSEYW